MRENGDEWALGNNDAREPLEKQNSKQKKEMNGEGIKEGHHVQSTELYDCLGTLGGSCGSIVLRM